MSRVSRVVATCVFAATMATANPAGAVPTEPILEDSVQRKARPVASSPSTFGSEIKDIAMTQIGAPYSYGGASPSGFDCSGFTSWVFAHVGITLPHQSGAQYSLGGSPGYRTIPEITDLEVGDLVFHATGGSGVGHVGIYVGDGQFISTTSSEGVQVRSLSDPYWGPLWIGAVRVSR